MKKIFIYTFLALMFCNVGVVEEKIVDPFTVTVNSLTKEGYKIVNVQQESGMLFYTLQKSKAVYLCRVIGLGGHETRCFRP